MASHERADSERLQEALTSVGRVLGRFARFDEQDHSGPNRPEWAARLDEPLPREGVGLDAVLDELSDHVIPNGLRNGAPGFAGWITTSPTTSGAAAGVAAMVAGSQRWWVQSFNRLETVALAWLAELCGLSDEMQGAFTSGGSVANLVCLGAARQHAFERESIDPALDGLRSDRPWRIYASSEVHHVITRAAGVLGLGRRAVHPVPCDDELRIDVNALRRTLDEDMRDGVIPVALVATAGTVNTGAIDPIADMADLAGEHGIWFHVDGAYGLFGRLDPDVAPLFDGLERADSTCVDPHKWMAAPVGTGAAFVRDPSLLGRAFTLEPAEYLEGSVTDASDESSVTSTFDSFGDQFHDFQVEQSAPSRGVTVWAILKEIGAEGMRERVVRHNGFARRLAALADADERLEVLSPPTLSICCFRYRHEGSTEPELDDLNTRIAAQLRAEHGLVPSTTRVNGKLALRPCYINPRTTEAEVEGLAKTTRMIGDSLIEA